MKWLANGEHPCQGTYIWFSISFPLFQCIYIYFVNSKLSWFECRPEFAFCMCLLYLPMFLCQYWNRVNQSKPLPRYSSFFLFSQLIRSPSPPHLSLALSRQNHNCINQHCNRNIWARRNEIYRKFELGIMYVHFVHMRACVCVFKLVDPKGRKNKVMLCLCVYVRQR